MTEEDHLAISRGLKQQAEKELQLNPSRAAAIAGLAIVAVLVDVAESLREIAESTEHTARDACSNSDRHYR